MIYFAQLPTGAIKIGFSDNVAKRLGELASHYGCELDLLHTMPGGRSVEAGLHEKFGHLRFGRTEQFQPAPELMAFIGQPLLVTANPEAVEAVEPRGHHIAFSVSKETLSRIEAFRAAQQVETSLPRVIRHLILKGLDVVAKEAAGG